MGDAQHLTGLWVEVHVRLAAESGDLLLRLLSDILDFSKIESGQLALENGEATAARPGRVVRGRGWTGWPDGGCRKRDICSDHQIPGNCHFNDVVVGDIKTAGHLNHADPW